MSVEETLKIQNKVYWAIWGDIAMKYCKKLQMEVHATWDECQHCTCDCTGEK